MGNLGIGTTSPYAKLSVVGEAVAQSFTATDTAATTTLQKTSISGAVSLLGEYFTNLTSYIRSRVLPAFVGTSSVPTIGNLAYWTGNGTPSTLGTVATTSASASYPLAFSEPFSVIGSSASTLSLAFGTTTANTWAELQTFSSGVSVGGTTFTALIPTTRALTVAGTANQITSSAGAQDLSADRTWTLSLPSHVIFPSSFQASSASTTNATTTSFAISSLLSKLLATDASGNVVGATAGTDYESPLTFTSPLSRSVNAVSFSYAAGANMLASLDASGNFVATSTPSAAAYYATSTSATSTLAGGLTVDGTTLVADYSSGRVGIGTAAPTANLEVNGSGASVYGLEAIQAYSSGANSFRARSTGTAATTFIDAKMGGNQIPTVEFLGNSVNIGGSLGNTTVNFNGGGSVATINGAGSGYSALSFKASSLSFQTIDSGTSVVERIKVGGTGNVGIGTTSPWARLSIENLVANGATPLFAVSTSTPTATTTALLIDGMGRIGIATTTPTAKLSVDGNVYVSDKLTTSYFTATDTAATTTLQKTSISGAVSLLGEYFTNLTSYIRSRVLPAFVGTSSVPTIGNLAYWTGNGTPSTLGTVATTSASASYPLAFSEPFSVIGSSASTLSLAFGTTTANTWAELQTFSSGVSVGGTTFTALIPTTRALTVAGTANQITSSAGAQDLSADRTWTLSLPSHVIFPSSFQASSASTTNATTTSFAISSLLSKLLATDASGNVVGATAGTDYESPLTFTSPLSRSVNAVSFSYAAGANMLASLDASGNFVATSTPSAAAYYATSTSATSTLAGGLTVDGTTLVADFSSGRVGIGTAAPSNLLHVLKNSIGETSTETGLSLTNETAATIGSDQFSPSTFWRGYGWDTGAAASQPVEFKAYVVPQFALTAPTGNFVIESSINDGPYGGQLNYDERGHLTLGGGVGTRGTEKLTVINGNLLISGSDTDYYIHLISNEDSDATPAYIWSEDTIGFTVGGTVGTPQMVVNAFSGNVGIGETAPGSKLSVSGGATVGASYDTTAAPTNGLIIEGNVGIGTTSPWALLSVEQGSSGIPFVVSDEGTSTPHFLVSKRGYVGIGTTSPFSRLVVAGAGANSKSWGNASSTAAAIQLHSTAAGAGDGGQILFSAAQGVFAGIKGYLNSGTGPAGSLYIQTRSTSGNLEPRVLVTYDGFVGVDALRGATANDLCYDSTTDAGFNTLSTCSSSIRYKEDVHDLVIDAEKVLALRPVDFKWRGRDERDIGLIAEEVESIIPELVTYKDGVIEGVKYKQLSVYLLGVLKEQQTKLEELSLAVLDGASATAGSALDGISRFVSVVTERLTVGSREKPSGITLYDEDTSEPYCLKIKSGQTVATPGECAAGGADGGEEGGVPDADTTPPEITIQGNNPAEVPIGVTYNDLGATAYDETDSERFVDTEGAEIDTSVAGEYTVTYAASDVAGNVATATRRVIVGGGAQDPLPDEEIAAEPESETAPEPELPLAEPESEPIPDIPPAPEDETVATDEP